jgi:hypothetical protein
VEKAQPHIPPGEGFGYFLEESIAILASSGVQEAASPDFQQIGRLNRSGWSTISDTKASFVFPCNLAKVARFRYNQ